MRLNGNKIQAPSQLAALLSAPVPSALLKRCLEYPIQDHIILKDQLTKLVTLRFLP